MFGGLSDMVLVEQLLYNKTYGNSLLHMFMKELALTLTAVPPPSLSVSPKASFATGISEAEASGCEYDESCSLSEQSNSTDGHDSQEDSIASCKFLYMVVKGPDRRTRIQQKEFAGWLALAKNKDDDEDDDDEDEDDEDEEDEDAADEDDVGDEGDDEEGVEGHDDAGGGEDDDDDDEDNDDDDDDENGKGGDEEDEEDGVDGEDEEDGVDAEDEEDGIEGEDEEDEDDDDEDEDEDDETPEPPLKKRK
ncbi:hypothetical protein KP509_29G071200 [Ceratopteris richardii]|uniref:Uncharacterized protein n=1 Tax=Ceratopteris richardii TaxID=49495 RepID=A0A8T2R9Y8_CERRI|nr:hypothetical protein KP509_29G071200 [Ceratopteris richardii]KAH7292498.1 hypothetical protein KP509_29G071200 [Ceratopteris richardii]